MEDKSIAAQLFAQAENLQTEARDLQARATQIYNGAAALKQLAVAVAIILNPEPIQNSVKEVAV